MPREREGQGFVFVDLGGESAVEPRPDPDAVPEVAMLLGVEHG